MQCYLQAVGLRASPTSAHSMIPGQVKEVKEKNKFRDRFNPKRRKMGRVSRTTELKLLALLSSFDPSAFDSALLGFDFTQGTAATAIEVSRRSTTD